ncbi:hypothetical protein KEJ48_01615 [Candidatus Bathyarchaeota archaeon]|nr:hypothetical protein [Candidatus Bathyarchaeota archaeon]
MSRVWRSVPELRDALSKLWWVVPESAVLPTWGPGGPVDWAAWLPAIIYTILLHFIVFLLVSAQMIFLRRRWIEIERLPYPWAIAIWEGVRDIHGFEEARRKRMPFILGLTVSFILTLTILLKLLFPWFPDIIGWRDVLGASPNGCVDAYCGDALKPIGSALLGFMRINVQPINFAIAYLIPLDVLFSAWFIWIIFIIVAQIAYVMGYYTGGLTASGACRTLGWSYGLSPIWHGPIYWGWMCTTGGMIAFFMMMLWFAKGYLGEVFRAAIGKSSPAIREIEAKEPTSYRMALAMLIIGSVLFIAFLASLQMDFIVGAIVFIFTGFIYPIVDAYAQGLIGAGYAWGRVQWSSWPLHLIYSRHPGYTPGLCMGLIMIHRELDIPSGYIVAWSSGTMHGFKLADLSGTHPSTIYKLMAITLLVAYPISVIFRVWWPHRFGARFPNCLSGWECGDCGIDIYNTAPPAGELMQPIVMGFIITILLFLLRNRLIWWPLHPMGFLIGGAQYTTWTGAWTNFLVAWIAKWLTLRVGGSKAYEGYGVPFIGGVIVGYVIVVVIGIVTGLIRWFIPF